MDIYICPMVTEADILGKAYVHYRSWQETYIGLVDASYMKTLTLTKCEKIANRFRDGILVAKDGDEVIGFVGYGAYRDDTMKDCGEIFAIYVLKAYHGKHVGLALMNAAMEKLSDYDRVALWVLRGNERAIRFYEKYGFRFDGTEQEILLGAPRMEARMLYKKEGSFLL